MSARLIYVMDDVLLVLGVRAGSRRPDRPGA